MGRRLILLCLLTSAFTAQSVLSEEDGTQDKNSDAEITDEAAGDGSRDGISKKSAGRVIEYGDDAQGGVVEATPHIREAEDLSAQKRDKKPDASASSKPQKKIEQQNSVKLITGGDPTEGSAKVGRLPVLD